MKKAKRVRNTFIVTIANETFYSRNYVMGTIKVRRGCQENRSLLKFNKIETIDKPCWNKYIDTWTSKARNICAASFSLKQLWESLTR